MALSIMTLSIMTLSITTLIIMGSFATLKMTLGINGVQQNDTQHYYTQY
jgi:hypothetical protein